MKYLIPALLLLLALPTWARDAAPDLLGADDIAALTAPPEHGERIIALWSLSCIYCEPHMQALARWQQNHPDDVELVLVATDGPTQRRAVAKRLKEAGVSEYRSYVYAEATPMRLNYLIDPDWGGVLPHTVVIHADGHRETRSGALNDKQLQQWLP